MCTQHSQRAQNTEKRDEGWSTQRREMRDGVREGVWEFWTKCEGLRGVWVFRLIQTMRFTPFFFFFLNFGLTRLFRPIQADMADTDRVGPIWAASAPISAASARFGNRHVAQRGTDTRSAASPRPAASDAGALA